MKADKHFDDKLREALENLRASLEPGSWEAFEQRLDHAPTDPTDRFDEVVSGKLANLAPTQLPGGDWSFMEKLIEADEAAEILEKEAVLDNVIYEKIERFEVPYQPQHWALMAKRLEEEVSLRYKIIRYKVAELALLALFLLTVVKYLPVIEEVIEPKSTKLSAGLLIPEKPAVSQAQPSSSHSPTTAIQNGQIASAQGTKPAAQQATQYLGIAEESQKGRTQNTDNQDNTDLGVKNGSSTPATLPPAVATNSQFNGPISKIASLGLSPLHSDRPSERPLYSSSLMPSQLKNTASPELISALGMQSLQPKFDWEIQPLPQLIFESQRELRFSLFANTSASYVFTPPNKLSVFDTIITTEPDTTFASGYGGGILVSWKKGKWEFQTGGMYSFKRYIPNTPVFLFETVNYYIREEFNGVQLDMMEVPLNTSYYFKNEGNWRVYGLGGLSANFVVASVYVIESERTPSFNALSIPVPNSLPENNRSIRQETEFPNGLFDGGALRDNFYLTANLGFGVERYVSPRWSLYLQPNYQHFFLSEGIGANKDRLNSFTFHLGTRVSLK